MEKMLELLLLTKLSQELPYDDENKQLLFKNYKYDVTKIEQRINSLVEEFFRPYVIDTASKEE